MGELSFVIGFLIGAFMASIVCTWWYATHYNFTDDRDRED